MADVMGRRQDAAGSSRARIVRPGVAVTVTWLGPEALVIVIGEVDAFTVPRLRARLDETIARGATRVTVDASQLAFIDSAGMAALTDVARVLRARGGDLVALDVRPGLVRILELLGVDRELTLQTAFAPR